MMRESLRYGVFAWLGLGLLAPTSTVCAGDPDPKSYWDVRDLRPGMKGVGRTVMVGNTLEEFNVEILGVQRGVSPGRDMILCRLSGCNLEHAGIIQGMSGSPITIDGKLVGAVAYAWEFGKDPIAGVTPFSQMVEYVRANERRVAIEGRDKIRTASATSRLPDNAFDRDAMPMLELGTARPDMAPRQVSGGGLSGMRPIAMPLSATGFSPRALAILEERLGPLGMAAIAGGGVNDDILAREGDKPLTPGSPVSVAMITGDFDLSGIGTVTHVEGERVYAFGHPMFGLGQCEFPMMTGWIHTVYPRASVSMKMGSPMKVVGVLDTDVSTAVSGRLGRKPDMMPMTVKVRVGPYSEPKAYRVEIAREMNLLSTLVMTVLTSAVDTEGNLPDELTARIEALIRIAGRDPLVVQETLSGSRYTGPTGPMALFASVGSTINLLARNPFGPVRIEAIDCNVVLEPRRALADLESIRVLNDRVEPGETLHILGTLKPYKGQRHTIEMTLTVPDDTPEGSHEIQVCDLPRSLQRRYRANPALLEPKSLDALVQLLRDRAAPTRTALYLHLARQGKGVTLGGQPLADLPGSVRTVLASTRTSSVQSVREDAIAAIETPWVVEGAQTVTIQVTRNPGLARIEPGGN